MVTVKGGCVLINTDTKEIAVVYRPSLEDYSFPKGHVEPGETVQEGAIRECNEETARDVELIRDDVFCSQTYTTPSGEEVEVRYFLAKDLGEYKGTIKEEDREICKWVPFDEVEDILTYESNKKMWREIKDLVAEELNIR